jgi:hypothetical protein
VEVFITETNLPGVAPLKKKDWETAERNEFYVLLSRMLLNSQTLLHN